MKFTQAAFIHVIILPWLLMSLCACKSRQATSIQPNVSGKSKIVPIQDQSKFTSYFIDGCKERMKGNIELAENLFKECLKLDPHSAPVKYELGNIYRLTGFYQSALKYAKDCALADPKNEWYQLLYIECLHHQQQFSQAAEVYSHLVKLYPTRADFYEGLASEYMYSGSYEKSVKTYDELGKKFGQNEAFTLNKIKLLKQLKKNEAAEQELKNLIRSNPNEARYYTYLAEFYQENNQQDKAMEVYNDILRIDPKNPMVHLALADHYKYRNDKDNFYKEVKIAFESPDLEVDTKLKILVSYYQLTEENTEYRKQADELCQLMLQVHPTSPEAHGIYADFLWRDKKIKEARDEYALATTFDKSKFAIWNQLMYADSELGDYKALSEHSTEAMELFPNQPFPYFFNGVANSQLKKYEQAISALKDGIEFVYDNKPLLLQFYATLGDAYNAIKEFEQSDKAFDSALKVEPDNTYILNNYAYYLSLRKKNLEKAEKYSRRSNELSPNNRSYIDTYGWILYQLGKYKEAEEWLGRAAKMGNKSAVILEHYGDVLYKLNKQEEAVNYWKEAKLAGQGSEVLDKKIADKKGYE